MRHILCPVDFSDFSQRALRHATSLARWYGADIHALYVAQSLPTLWHLPPHLDGPPPPDPALARLRDELHAFLAPTHAAGVSAEASVVDGQPAAAILDHARRNPADLVVMGTHGRGGVGRLVLGSVAETVLRHAPCPVLTVRSAERWLSARAPFRRILCPVDFSPASDAALAHALSLAAQLDADITLLHVVEPPHRGLVEDAEQAIRAGERLRRAMPADARDWCRPREVLAVAGRVSEAILDEARKSHADLIVMGVQGRRALGVMLFGSNTHEVVRHAECPVMTLASAAAATARSLAVGSSTPTLV
jgi:nucleotide-binding universal stress UspA family protein